MDRLFLCGLIIMVQSISILSKPSFSGSKCADCDDEHHLQLERGREVLHRHLRPRLRQEQPAWPQTLPPDLLARLDGSPWGKKWELRNLNPNSMRNLQFLYRKWSILRKVSQKWHSSNCEIPVKKNLFSPPNSGFCGHLLEHLPNQPDPQGNISPRHTSRKSLPPNQNPQRWKERPIKAVIGFCDANHPVYLHFLLLLENQKICQKIRPKTLRNRKIQKEL